MKYILIITLIIVGIANDSSGQRKIALIVGNSDYSNGTRLINPINDAKKMKESLESLGFETIYSINASNKDLKLKIKEFGEKLDGYDVALFYYAGHGISNKGRNYLIPTDANIASESQIEFDCVESDRILKYMEYSNTKVNIIILDACRNNPFGRSWNRGDAGGGLTEMDAPKGSLIAFATAPGKVASDGDGENGLYTSSILKYLQVPGLALEQLFKRVRTEVIEKSKGIQIPWESTSLVGDDFILNTNSNDNKRDDVFTLGTFLDLESYLYPSQSEIDYIARPTIGYFELYKKVLGELAVPNFSYDEYNPPKLAIGFICNKNGSISEAKALVLCTSCTKEQKESIKKAGVQWLIESAQWKPAVVGGTAVNQAVQLVIPLDPQNKLNALYKNKYGIFKECGLTGWTKDEIIQVWGQPDSSRNLESKVDEWVFGTLVFKFKNDILIYARNER